MANVKESAIVNVAEAKRRLSELLGRVAFGGARVLITRRGRPMAQLVPPDQPEAGIHLADVRGWLSDEDPFFRTVDEIVAERTHHVSRAVRAPRRRSGPRRR